MKLLLGLTCITLSTALYAEELVKVNVCIADCIGINTRTKSLDFLGSLEGLALSERNAWKKLQDECRGEAALLGTQGVLVREALVFNAEDESSSSSSFGSSGSAAIGVGRRFIYAEASMAVSGSQSYSSRNGLSLSLTYAHRSENCGEEWVDEEELQPRYGGDLRVMY